MLRKSIVRVMVLTLLVGVFLPLTKTFAATEEKVQTGVEGEVKTIDAGDNYDTFQIQEEDGTYEYKQTILNVGTQNEEVKVDRYLVAEDGSKEFVETASVKVNSPKVEAFAAAAKKKCVGGQGVSLKYAVTTVKLNSCTTKKILNITDDASGAAGAIAGISAVIRSVSKFSGHVGAVAGVIWASRFVVDKVSAGGKYGFAFTTTLPPSGIMVPWRNK